MCSWSTISAAAHGNFPSAAVWQLLELVGALPEARMGYSTLSASDLFKACTECSDPAAWEEFVLRFHQLIAAVALRRARRWGTTAAVDDVIQEIYTKLCADGCRRLREFEPRHRDSEFGYLKVVSANAANDYLKSLSGGEGCGRLPEQLDKEAGLPENLPSEPQPRQLSTTERKILIDEIDAFLHRSMPPQTRDRDRRIFWLHYRVGMSASAIAALPSVGLTAKGIESIIHRSTRLVREELIRTSVEKRTEPKGFYPRGSL
jgi:RNA polymerase sigma factor (sigma-70 family)